MPYLLLMIAIGSEVAGTSLLKSTEGFTNFWPTLGTLIAYAFSFWLMAQVVRHVPVGVAYAIWSAVGTGAVVAVGAIFLKQSVSQVQILGLILIVTGVVTVYAGTTN